MEGTQFFSLTGQAGSLAYMAPEVYRGDKYNHTADVFSFAIMAYEALECVHPFFRYLMEKRHISGEPLGNNKTLVK